ncbi:hypothetical protein TWF506_011287 [Arthrobotrys conoides]|uniref:Uncharacterized protein n=1 Tax=Arthrobotrys conoides TaxID=74498 RepID=A0AAN8RNH1_9PEZI
MLFQSLPPELHLQIAKLLKPDCGSLHNLRLAAKSIYHITTEALFEEISIKYGLTRSISQMKSLADSIELRPLVQSLVLPSESFFPISGDFIFPENSKLPWTRNPQSTPDALEPSKKSDTRGNDQAYKSLKSGPEIFYENPSRSWVEFNPRFKKYRQQQDGYINSLVNLIKSLPNLKRIHIAMGIFWESSRMLAWCSLFEETLWKVIADAGVFEIEIEMPEVTKGFLGMLHGYADDSFPSRLPRCWGGGDSQAVVFRSVKSFKINVNAASAEDYLYLLRPKLTGFFSHLPNLTSYSFRNSRLLNSFDLPPPLTTCQKLASLKLSNIKLGEDDSPIYKRFKAAIVECSLLEHLELDTMMIFPTYHMKINSTTIDQTGSHIPYPPITTTCFDVAYEKIGISSDVLTDCFFQGLTWGNVFNFLANSLGRLKRVEVRNLMYGREARYARGLLVRDVLLPTSYKEYFALAREEKRVVEVVSSLRSDYSKLESLKGVVGRRGAEERFCDRGDNRGGGEACEHKYWNLVDWVLFRDLGEI